MDVFIIDTGLDTQHIEFAQRPGDHVRTIKNLYDAFGPSPDSPSINTDGEGHGTHVAGTVQCSTYSTDSTVQHSTAYVYVILKYGGLFVPRMFCSLV